MKGKNSFVRAEFYRCRGKGVILNMAAEIGTKSSEFPLLIFTLHGIKRGFNGHCFYGQGLSALQQ
jgi:hypothetical protein